MLGELSATESRERVRAARVAEVAGLAERGADLVGGHVGSVRDQLGAALFSSALSAQATACFFDGFRAISCADGLRRVLRDVKELLPARTGEVALVASAILRGQFQFGTRQTPDFEAGDVLATSGAAPQEGNVAATDYFAAVSRSGLPIVSFAQRATDVGSLSMTVAVPGGGKCVPPRSALRPDDPFVPCRAFHYILTAEVPLDAARAWLAPLLAAAEDAYLLDSTGRLLARAAAPAGAEALRDLSGDPTVSAALAGARGAQEGDDPRGSGRRLLAVAPVPELGWHVVVVRSSAPLAAELEALDQLSTLRLSFVALLLVVTFGFARTVSHLIERIF